MSTTEPTMGASLQKLQRENIEPQSGCSNGRGLIFLERQATPTSAVAFVAMVRAS